MMEIKGKVHCFFEQSGTFKNEFIKLGYQSEDYDIQNNFGQNFLPPTIIDRNRLERGDYFKKPTAYWFIGCENTVGFSYQNDKEQKIIRNCQRSKGDGLCSEERSMISPDYARNFICDFIIGKQQDIGQMQLF